MSRIWAIGQTIAVDTGLSGSVFRVFVLAKRKQYIQMSLYLVLSAMLLFTAVIVSNIESLQQTLGISLTEAYTHSPIPVEALVWLRSFSIILLIIGHAVKHADGHKDAEVIEQHTYGLMEETTDHKGEKMDEQVTVTEDVREPLQIEQPEVVQELLAPKKVPAQRTDVQAMLERVRLYMLEHPNATARQAGSDLGMSPSTANKYMRQLSRK